MSHKISSILSNSPAAIGARMRLLRRTAGLTIANFIKLAGVTHPSMSYWENGNMSIKTNSVAKVLAGFEKAGISVSEQWLLAGEGPVPTYKGEKLLADPPQKSAIEWPEEISAENNTQLATTLADEMKLFASVPHSVIMKVDHSRLVPFLDKGDLVGGIWQIPSTLTEPTLCIFKSNDKLQADCINPQEMSTKMPEKVAPIIRVWR